MKSVSECYRGVRRKAGGRYTKTLIFTCLKNRMYGNNITLLDFLVLPFVLLFVYAIAYRYRNRHYPGNHPYRKYFIPGLTLKIAGAIFIGLVYEYYYRGGDTMNYFYHARVINSSFADSPVKWVNLLFRLPNENAIGYYQYTSQMMWYNDPSSYSVGAIAAFLGIFTATTYLPISVLFAAFSFTGAWALFRTFAGVYPALVRPVAIASLMIPSVIVWGSGIFKDTICMFALGWFTYGVFQILIQRNFRTANLLLTVFSLFLLYRIKVYILIAFLPAIVLWILFTYTAVIRDNALRVLVKMFVFIIAVTVSGFVFMNTGDDLLGRYSFSNIEKTADVTREWIQYSSGDEGSAYDLGVGDGLGGMLLKVPAAVNVTLFRPYLWEARKVLVFFNALESLLFLFLTLKILFVIGFGRVWRTIMQDANLQFFLVFTIIFAAAVGLTTGNFGTLSRYKIPCLPFYGLALVIIYYKNRPLSQKLLKPLGL